MKFSTLHIRLYNVTILNWRLNEQIKRNIGRFPEDFMFQLKLSEKEKVVANCDHLSKLRFSHVLPFAFTEHGALMAASVLNSKEAIGISVFIIRAFVQMRNLLSQNKELKEKLDELESKLLNHDEQIIQIISALKSLIENKAEKKKPKIGF